MNWIGATLRSLAMLMLVALSSDPVAGQDCDWCTVEFTGTEITGYGCSTEAGIYELHDCVATTDGCDGEICGPAEEDSPDMASIALRSRCSSRQHHFFPLIVIADMWNAISLPLRRNATQTGDEILLVSLDTSSTHSKILPQ